MKDYTDKWFEILSNFSPAIQLILYIISSIVFIFLFLMRFRKFRDGVFIFLTNKLKISLEKKIFSHELFYRKSYYLNIIRKVKFDSSVKTFAFKTILRIKQETVIDEFLSHFKKINIKGFNDNQLFDTFNAVIYNVVELYEKRIIELFKQKYNDAAGKELYRYIYEEHFEPLHDKRIRNIVENIKPLCFNQFLSNTDKTIIFLTFILYALDSAIVDIETTFKNFNGKPDAIVNKHNK